eukprot:s3145_g5.t1
MQALQQVFETAPTGQYSMLNQATTKCSRRCSPRSLTAKTNGSTSKEPLTVFWHTVCEAADAVRLHRCACASAYLSAQAVLKTQQPAAHSFCCRAASRRISARNSGLDIQGGLPTDPCSFMAERRITCRWHDSSPSRTGRVRTRPTMPTR